MANDPAGAGFSPAHKRYMIALVALLSLISYLDRQLPSILLPSIRRELHLTDTQLGFITGLAFALFYSIMALPLGYMVDRYSRRIALTVCAIGWSVMTTLTGFTSSFALLALARFGVGIGEAGLAPNMYSIISDIYPPKGRATALSVTALGIPLGSGFAFLLGGYLDAKFGWRSAFMLMGVPGVVLGLLIFFTLGDPQRGHADQWKDTGTAPPLCTVFKTLWRNKSYCHLVLGVGFAVMANSCITTWAPSYLSRSFGMTSREIGFLLVWPTVIGGGIGTFFGGFLVDRLRDRDLRWAVWLPGIALLLSAVPAVLAFLSGSSHAAILCLSAPLLLIPVYIAPFSSTVQGLSALRMRGTAAAISLLITSGILGNGIGPQLVGKVSDLLRPSYGEESLRHALVFITPICCVWGAFHYFWSARTLAKDIAAVRAAGEAVQ